LIGRRKPADIDYETLYAEAARHGVMMEINAHPARLDLDDVQAAAAKARGIPIVIDTDSHSTDGLDMMEFGIYQARRAGLTAADVANARPWSEFSDLLAR
jgi:DNA polymerase (family 10)